MLYACNLPVVDFAPATGDQQVFPHWANTGDYSQTKEAFGVIPLQKSALTEAVNRLDLGEVKLTREQDYLAKHQNVKRPFTPVTSVAETESIQEIFRMRCSSQA